MEAMNQKITAVADELGLMRAELIQIKSAHATMHQAAVDSGANNTRAFTEQAARIEKIEKGFENVARGAAFGGGGDQSKRKDLIEAKQVNVEIFAGAMTDDRAKYLAWAERVKDRVELFDPVIATLMTETERGKVPITAEESRRLGATDYGSAQLHGFLKDKT